MKMTFEDDLATGMIAEQRILSKVQGRYPLAFQMQGKVKAFDIFVPEVMRGIEVKNDSKAHRTGNVFIEYECDGSGSGITTTLAHTWVYCTKEKEYWVLVEALRGHIEQSKPRTWCNQPEGAVTVVRAYIIPSSEVEAISEGVFNYEN